MAMGNKDILLIPSHYSHKVASSYKLLHRSHKLVRSTMNHRIHVMSHELIYQLCYHKSATYIYIYILWMFSPCFVVKNHQFPMVFLCFFPWNHHNFPIRVLCINNSDISCATRSPAWSTNAWRSARFKREKKTKTMGTSEFPEKIQLWTN